jgi:hypothetical protein
MASDLRKALPHNLLYLAKPFRQRGGLAEWLGEI